MQIPEQDDEVLRAVKIVGKNTGIGGEPVWCLNRNLSIGRDGYEVEASHHGLEWLSHLTDCVKGGEIADESLAAEVEGELTTIYFDAMMHFLAGTLEREMEEDTHLKLVVSELFGHDQCLCFDSDKDDLMLQEPSSPVIPVPADDISQQCSDLQRENFLSQFILASMGCVMANYQEVSNNYW